ncbi:MAG TPA: hypothetical protein VEC12_05470, partial [Bacteroidia bacterium]|nr:hypothetical protein [Bacteroidia bacterium]
MPHNGWTNVVQAGDLNFDTWRFTNPGSRTVSSPASGQVAQFDSDWNSLNGGAEDVSLTTPIIDTRGYDSVWVKWDHQFQAGFGGAWRVEAFNGLAWVTVIGPNTTAIAWRSDSVNISTACANRQNARVRFRWTGNYSWWWQVDNIRVYSPVRSNECATIGAAMFAGQCGSATDSVRLTIRNTSNASMNNIPVKAQVTGTIGASPINSTVTSTYTGTLAPGQIAVMSLGAFNTLAGGTIDVAASTDVASDTKRTNDSVKLTGVSIFGTPALPTPANNARCGAGPVILDGGIIPGNTGIWYDNAVTTAPSWSGSTRSTPTMSTPSTITYYVSQARISTFRNVNPGYGGAVWYGATNPGGNMFTVTAINNLIIDSLGVHIPNTNGASVSVYYKTGGSAGFENNPSAWTLLSTLKVTGAGVGAATRIKIDPLTIPAGQTYSVYVRSDNEMQFSSGTYSATNADLTLTSATAVSGLFGGSNPGYSWNGTMYYRIYCESNRVAVTATANPAPQASDLDPVVPFRGKRFDGTVSSPDIVAPPDSVQYDILTPSGFLVSGYGSGSAWYVSNVDARTLSGTVIPAADHSILAPAGGNGARLRFRPSTGLIDNTVRFRITLKRNDNGCDTVIERIIYIAPRPKADFNFPPTCDGQQIVFSNSSNITPSGSISHQWYFGDSAASDF